MNTLSKLFLGFIFALGIIVLAVGLSLLMAFPVMWIANYLFTPAILTAVFGVAKLTFWRAFWLNFLCSVLFKSSASSSSSSK